MQPELRSSLSPQAAMLRGGDYQHLIGWLWVCRMLKAPDWIASVTFEDSEGGAFDDVVVRRHRGPDLYIQAKSSNHGGKPINSQWLLKAKTPASSSPLQRFHGTFEDLTQSGASFDLEICTNRTLDPRDPLLGKLRDLKHDRIDTQRMLAATPRSAAGKQRDLWADHLGIDAKQLAEFLTAVRWRHIGSESILIQQAQDAMAAAGLRNDQPAACLGVGLVRGWVTDGHGPINAEAAGRRAAEMGLAPLDQRPVPSANGTGSVCLPATCREPIEALRESDPDAANRVEHLLGDRSSRTQGVLAATLEAPPDWLEEAGHLAFEAAAEFLAAHDLPGVGAARRAAERLGSPRSDLWRILEAVRAALADHHDQAATLLAQTSAQHPLFEAAKALTAGNHRAAAETIEATRACDDQDPAVALIAHTMLADAYWGCGDTTNASRVLETACGRFPDRGGLFLTRAKLLMTQAGNHPYGSDRARGLLESAVELALQARDSRRHWNGPSGAAVVVATDALVRLDDPQRLNELAAAAPDGEATPQEAEAVDVVRARVIALLALGRRKELDELDLEVFDESEGAHLAALRAHARGDHNAVELMREAVAQAVDGRELARALHGLSLFGETDESAMERLDEISEADKALMRAAACYYRQDYAKAVEALKPHQRASVVHTEMFAASKQALGDGEDAVECLLQAAHRQPASHLYGTAAEMLVEMGDLDRAEEVLLDALAGPVGRRQERSLRIRLLNVARQRQDWRKAESYSRKLLKEFPDETTAVWAIVEACVRRGDGAAAWETVVAHDARPCDETTARLAIGAFGLADPDAPDAGRLLDIVEGFAHHDQIVGAALGAVMLKAGDPGMIAADQKRFAQALDAHCERFEESQTLRRFNTATVEDMAAVLESLVKAPSEEDARFVGLVRSGNAPYGMLAEVRSAPYAEHLVSMAAGALTAVSSDGEERSRERHAARGALGSAVAADTSVAALALHAGIDPQDAAAAFKRVLVADELISDASHAVSRASTTVVGRVFFDPAADQLIPLDAEEHHKQLREKLDLLVDTLRGWHAVASGPISGRWDDETDKQFRPWDAALRVAANSGCALWCDDMALRRWAHSEGIPTFGTYALCEEMESRQTLTPADMSDLKGRLLAAGVADVPLTWNELTAIANSDSTAQAAQRFLERPSSWHQPEATLRWYFERFAAAADNSQADHVVGLLQAATIGAGTTADPSMRRRLLGDLLASAILKSCGFGLGVVPQLVLASRRGCWAIDPSGGLDVLRDATESLLYMHLTDMEPATAATSVLGLFKDCEEADRNAVASGVLLTRRGQRRTTLPAPDSTANKQHIPKMDRAKTAVPGYADARDAAEALRCLGARQVLLFGSVAAGTAGTGSDIDLVAVFDDLGDYSTRQNLESEARRAAENVTGWSCDILVTDRVEWHARSVLSTTIESEIARSARMLVDLPAAAAVCWGKPIAKPVSDEAEAAADLRAAAHHMSIVINHLSELPIESEARRAANPDRVEAYRFARMRSVCESSHGAVSAALRAYTKGVRKQRPRRGHGQGRIAAMLDAMPDDARLRVESAFRVAAQAVDEWEQRPGVSLPADLLGSVSPASAADMAQTAAECCLFAAHAVERALGPSDETRKLLKMASSESFTKRTLKLRNEAPLTESAYEHYGLRPPGRAAPSPSQRPRHAARRQGRRVNI